MQFFTFWLSQKLAPASTIDGLPEPSYFNQLGLLANNESILFHQPQSYFIINQNNEAQMATALVQAGLNATTSIGFPQPSSKSLLDSFIDFVGGLLNSFLSLLVGIWDLITHPATAVKYMISLWDNVAGPTIGFVKQKGSIVVRWQVNN